MSQQSDPKGNAAAWGLPGVLDFFDQHRARSSDVYPSEWHFLKDLLREGIRILDVGCAQGGFAAIVAEHLRDFSYVGLDINPGMLARARSRFPRHDFHLIEEGNFALPERDFDLVLVLGSLHLHEAWRETLASAWRCTGGALVFDLRETHEATVENGTRSFMKMDFGRGDEQHAAITVPYIVINETEARATVEAVCAGAASLDCFGYVHSTTASAVTPFREVVTRVWCARRVGAR